MDGVAISVDKVSKRFKIPHERYTSLKQSAIHLFSQKKYTRLEAVNDVSFEVKKGEFFGIVGRNGSGKSTLLKMLAGIYQPTAGKITINGTLSPFIELGVGFNPELTARENVYLNGAILGLSRKQVTEKFDEIIGFGELEEFVDQKLKNFSSGMQVRLAFSIAIQAHSDVLLIDEVLAVGDANFQTKCFETFEKIKSEGRTVVFVTHDMGLVRRFCDRGIIINDGQMIHEGTISRMIEDYLRFNYEQESPKENISKVTNRPSIKSFKLLDSSGKAAVKTNPEEEYVAEIIFSNYKKAPIHFGFQIFDMQNAYCFGTNTRLAGFEPVKLEKGKVRLQFNLKNMATGSYKIHVAAMDRDALTQYDYRLDIYRFYHDNSTGYDGYEGILRMSHKWELDV